MDTKIHQTAAARCAACNHMRRKCPPNCIFAPYFPTTSPATFHYVHEIYGRSNVKKILESLPVAERRAAAEKLAFDAEARIRDPVLGCVGYIYLLQQRLAQLHHQLQKAEAEARKSDDGAACDSPEEYSDAETITSSTITS